MVSQLVRQKELAIGHTLATSEAVDIAVYLQAIATQILLLCVGLKHPGFELNLVILPRHVDANTRLRLSFGLSEQNAAVAIGKFH